ncbi:hypothetical protein ACFLTE_05475 [Bacteroidota bacterium]
MRKLLLFIVILLCVKTYSQVTDTINWSAKRLSWEDFRGTPTSSSIIKSRINFNIEYNFERDPKQMNILHFNVKNYIHTKYSWVREEYETDLMLLYNQTIFDIAELYARKIQYKLNRTTVNQSDVSKTADSIYTKIFFQCQDEISAFQKESDFGANKSIIHSWSDSIMFELEQNPKERIPEYSLSKIGYGLDIFTGTSLLNGNIGKNLNLPFHYGYGFEFLYHKFSFHFRAKFGFTSLKTEYNNTYLWPYSLKINTFNPDFSIGYPIISISKNEIRPYAGIAWYAVSPNSGDTIYNGQDLSNYSVIFGMQWDYKLRRGLSYNFLLKEETYLNIRTQIYVVPINIDDYFKGSSINLSFGISGIGHHINIKNGK